MTLVFSGLSFILHLAHHFASFRRSFCKRFAAMCTFLLAAHSTVSSAKYTYIYFFFDFFSSFLYSGYGAEC